MGGSANGGGRPSLPEGDLSTPDTAIIPNGEGEASPRGKQEEAGEMPAPSEPSGLEDLLGGLGGGNE